MDYLITATATGVIALTIYIIRDVVNQSIKKQRNGIFHRETRKRNGKNI